MDERAGFRQSLHSCESAGRAIIWVSDIYDMSPSGAHLLHQSPSCPPNECSNKAVMHAATCAHTSPQSRACSQVTRVAFCVLRFTPALRQRRIHCHVCDLLDVRVLRGTDAHVCPAHTHQTHIVCKHLCCCFHAARVASECRAYPVLHG